MAREPFGQYREQGLRIIKNLGAYKSERDFRDYTERSMASGFGIKLSTLSGTSWRVDVKKEPVWERVNGEYTVDVGTPGHGHVPIFQKRSGWHNTIVGDRIVDASLESRTSHYLSTSLIYFVTPNRYLLVIGRKQTEFSTPDVDVLAKFVDQAFLEYATQTSGEIPDFAASKREAETEVRSSIGKIIP